VVVAPSKTSALSGSPSIRDATTPITLQSPDIGRLMDSTPVTTVPTHAPIPTTPSAPERPNGSAGLGAPRPLAVPPGLSGQVFLGKLRQPGTLVRIGLLLAAGVWLFWAWLVTQNHYSHTSGDWSHAYMVPLICGYLMWQHRSRLDTLKATVFWPGLIPVVMGIWSYVFFVVGVPNHLGQGLSMTLTVFGLSLLLLGPRWMTYLFFPIAYLFFAITIPEKVMNHATWPLQNLAAKGGWVALNMIGIKTDIAGNQLTVFDSTTFESHPLNVAEACSGMRMLIAFLALGAAVALVATRMWWKRVVLIGLAAPLAVLLNIIRIMVLGIASLYDQDLSAGEAHTFIGTLLLIPGFFAYMLILVALNKAVPEAPEKPQGKPSSPKPLAGATA
jgi:exosortase